MRPRSVRPSRSSNSLAGARIATSRRAAIEPADRLDPRLAASPRVSTGGTGSIMSAPARAGSPSRASTTSPTRRRADPRDHDARPGRGRSPRPRQAQQQRAARPAAAACRAAPITPEHRAGRCCGTAVTAAGSAVTSTTPVQRQGVVLAGEREAEQRALVCAVIGAPGVAPGQRRATCARAATQRTWRLTPRRMPRASQGVRDRAAAVRPTAAASAATASTSRPDRRPSPRSDHHDAGGGPRARLRSCPAARPARSPAAPRRAGWPPRAGSPAHAARA